MTSKTPQVPLEEIPYTNYMADIDIYEPLQLNICKSSQPLKQLPYTPHKPIPEPHFSHVKTNVSHFNRKDTLIDYIRTYLNTKNIYLFISSVRK